MNTNKRKWLVAAWVAVGARWFSPAGGSSLIAADAPPDKGLAVTEWVILVGDPNVPKASGEGLFQSTLPDFIAGRRPAAPAQKMGEPSPIGVIRLSGGAADERVDVLLENKGGKFFAQWPKAQQRSSGILWQNLEPKAAGVPLEPVPGGNWYNRLREPAGPYWVRDNKGERFILYDPELNYTAPLKLKTAPGGAYELNNAGSAPLRDVTLYQKKEDGWHTATLGELPPGAKPAATTKPATKPAAPAAQAPSVRQSAVVVANRVFVRRVAVAAADAPEPAAPRDSEPAPTVTATTAPTTTATTTTTAPTTTAATRPAAKLALNNEAAKDQAAAFAPWADRLTAAGLPSTDFELILSILQRQAADPKRVTAVYRLDPAELDRLMPLEVTPQPKKIVRVGLVVMVNIDPALGDEIDQLVAQLGSDEWAKREAAYKQLVKLGIAAKPKLQAALKHKDLEVVYRAEKLIQALTAPPPPQQGNDSP